jgi:hypothetical protein
VGLRGDPAAAAVPGLSLRCRVATRKSNRDTTRASRRRLLEVAVFARGIVEFVPAPQRAAAAASAKRLAGVGRQPGRTPRNPAPNPRFHDRPSSWPVRMAGWRKNRRETRDRRAAAVVGRR